jgi:isomaltose glucohydrolase
MSPHSAPSLLDWTRSCEIAADAQTAAREIRETIRRDGIRAGHAVKWLGSTAVDGSLFACVAPFQVFDEAVSHATVAAVERDLVVDGGVYRYRDDTFYGGGRWPVLAAFHGLALVSSGRSAAAFDALGWIASTATSEGYLPEQVGPRLHVARQAEWVDRWGTIATPLLWSHGMFLILADELEIHS